MSNPIKTKPKTLRGRNKTIPVDTQILAWRKKLKKQGIKLGKHMERAEKHAEYVAKSRETDTPEKLLESFKKRFGG